MGEKRRKEEKTGKKEKNVEYFILFLDLQKSQKPVK
jgi:hypothetical protein